MDDVMCLTVFEQCLKGKWGQEWWDHISTMCETLSYNEPRMRYEFFLNGLRNKQMKSMLNSSMVTSFPEACVLLLYKNLHLPVEEDDEFQDVKSNTSKETIEKSNQSQKLQQLQQMSRLLLQQQRLGTQPRGQINAAVPPPPNIGRSEVPSRPTGTNPQNGQLRIRLGPDTHTTKGITVCSRCERVNRCRETFPRAVGRCNRCLELGHYSMEYNLHKTDRRNGGRQPGGSSTTCVLCGESGHMMA
ncbi:hypothetical protein PHMEG_0005305 [Phytophthora megakarya]|uniref:Uncharacterized protein n=1 Tax=Phytophthora megakarya TaxID=4795 RepID=A0A225WT80_9STRA|nr:hypothetical protein PHMEG_0005305 [Phytophthora megakarya]